jgi:hypothetical protein
MLYTLLGAAAVAIVVAFIVLIVLKLRSGRELFSDLTLSAREIEENIARTREMKIQPREGVGPLRFGMTPEQAIEALGPPEHRFDRPDIRQTILVYRKLGLHLTFDTSGIELRAIICLSDGRETAFSRGDKPAITFAGTTDEGIGLGNSMDDVRRVYGEPQSSEQYFPERRGQPSHGGDVAEHAYMSLLLMILEKNGKVVEIHVIEPTDRLPSSNLPQHAK